MKFLLALLPTIMLTAYGQLMTKWRVSKFPELQHSDATAFDRLLVYITDPYIISAYVFSFLSSVAWLYVVEKYPVSIAFPAYVGILFSVVLLGSSLLLHEPISLQLIAGIVIIITGVAVASYAA